MNVNDVESVAPVKDKLVEIFERQEELAHKYIGVEKRNGIGYGILPEDYSQHNLDSRFTQALLKDFAWRSIEEITEATEALAKSHEIHPQEEIADALHFLVELCLIAGYGPEDIGIPPRPGFEGDMLDYLFHTSMVLCENVSLKRFNARVVVYNYVEHLGIAMNCLKNKPWKQSQFITDKAKFKQAICNAFHSLIDVAVAFEMNAGLLYDFYFKKNQVNQFRVRSKY